MNKVGFDEVAFLKAEIAEVVSDIVNNQSKLDKLEIELREALGTTTLKSQYFKAKENFQVFSNRRAGAIQEYIKRFEAEERLLSAELTKVRQAIINKLRTKFIDMDTDVKIQVNPSEDSLEVWVEYKPEPYHFKWEDLNDDPT